jgi:hypothetical protein
MSIDLVDANLKAYQLGNMKFDNFDDVMPKLLNYFSKNKVIDWSKPGCRTTYNNIKIFEILGFKVSINKIEKKTKAEVNLKYKKSPYNISVKILIRLQDFFQYKVVEYLKKASEINDKIKQYFMRHNLMDSQEIEISTDEIRYNVKDELVNDKKLAIEVKNDCDFNSYRVDMLLHITGKYYLCLEFFENHHKNPNEVDLSNELHRIMSLVYNNKSISKKIVHVGVFWESNIDDEKKFNNFMKKVVINNIEKYWNIDNERDYIISAICKELGCDKEVAQMFYESNEQPNKPVILLDIINKIVIWKKDEEDECKEKVLKRFTKKINQFQEKETDEIILPDDDIVETEGIKQTKESKIYYNEETDCLTNYGLTLYISYLITSNVLNSPKDEEYWNDFNAKITRGFIEGLKKIRKDTLSLSDKFMTGLYDCY